MVLLTSAGFMHTYLGSAVGGEEVVLLALAVSLTCCGICWLSVDRCRMVSARISEVSST